MELYEDESYNFKTFECLPHPYWMPHFENAFDVSVHLMMKQILMWVKKNIIKVREEAAKRRRRSSLIVGDTEKFAYCTRTSSLSIPSSSSSVPPQGLHKADSPHTVHITVPTPCRSHSRSNGSSGASTPSSSGGAGSPVGSRRGNSSGSSGVGSRSGSKGASGRGSSGSSSPMSSPGSDGQCVVSDSEEITGSWSHKKQLRRRHSCEISHAVIDDSTRAKESVEDSSSKEGSPSISIDISVGESSGSGGGVAGSPTTTTITTTTTTTSSSSSSSYVKPVAAAASSGGGARKHGSLTGSSGSAGRASTMGRARTNGLKRSIDGSSSSSSCSRSGSDINGSSSAKISIRGGTSLSTPGSPASPSSPSPSYTSTMVSMFSNINKQTQKYSNEDTMASVNVIPRGITTSRKNEFLEQQKRSMEYLHIPGLEMQQIQELLQGIRSKSKEQLLNKASAGYKREEVFDAARTYDQENERRPPVEELKKMFDSWAPTKYEFMYRDSNELAHTSSGYSLSTASSKFSFNIFQNTGAAASTTTSASASSSSQSQSTSTPIITVSATDVAQPQQQQQQQTITITTTTITTVPLSPPSSSMSPPPPPMAPSSSSSPVPTSSLLMHAPIPSPAVVPPVASPSSTLSTPSSSLSPPAPVPVVACSSPALPDGLPLAQVPPQVP